MTDTTDPRALNWSPVDLMNDESSGSIGGPLWTVRHYRNGTLTSVEITAEDGAILALIPATAPTKT